MNDLNRLADHWRLDRRRIFLNHGSFGATPKVVLEAQRRWQEALEADPIEFLAPERGLEAKLDRVRRAMGRLVQADPQDLAWVRNATDGVNAVVRSFPFQPGDEVVVTDHGYNACNNAVRFAAERAAARCVVAAVPFPLQDPAQVVEAVTATFTPRTRLLVIDHVTSPTGLILPIRPILDAAHRRGIRVLVDGAHAPGMVPVALDDLGADYYTANHHKWLCAPKASGFLFVQRRWQGEVRPTVISHAANRPRPGRTQFTAEFDWNGTYDPTPLLATEAALTFLEGLLPGGLAALQAQNRQLALAARRCLADRLGIPLPAPDTMIGSLATLPLPPAAPSRGEGIDSLPRHLREVDGIEVPIFFWPSEGHRCLRISAQAYNRLDQYQRLAEALIAALPASSAARR